MYQFLLFNYVCITAYYTNSVTPVSAPDGKKGFQVTTFVKPESPFSFNNAAKICGGEQSHAEKSGGESGK
jgi:hypothetical protein